MIVAPRSAVASRPSRAALRHARSRCEPVSSDAVGAAARPPRHPLLSSTTEQKAHIVSTTLLTDDRQHTTSTHPPDTGDRQILSIPDRTARQRLPLSDRLSLRLGLWLLERGLHTRERQTRRASTTVSPPIRREAITEHEAANLLLSYDLQRGLR